MAVEAHHLLHTGGTGGQRQLLAHAGAWEGDGAACYEAPAGAARQQLGHRSPACHGGARELVVAAGQQHQAGFQHSCLAAPAAPSSAAAARQLVMPGQYAAGASESGVTFGGAGACAHQEAATAMAMAMAPRKRKHADISQGQALAMAVPRLVTVDMAAHFQQQLVDVDRLVLQHTTKMRAEMTEQRRRHARQVVAAVEAAAAKRLRSKDEEIERISRLNWALEERVRSLYVEAQVWRDLAQSNEAAASALRGELQQALDAQQAHRGGGVTTTAVGADDAESCCCGENDVVIAAATGAGNSEDEAGTSLGRPGRRTCTMCGEGAAEVVLLPCRHLCACAALACPACGCDKNGSVCINFS